MKISNQEEFKLSNGQVVSIQFHWDIHCWEVACWNIDDTMHWYKDFDNEKDARFEYERWKK